MSIHLAKRLRHPGGMSILFVGGNVAGEWSLVLMPENVLIDTFHTGPVAHIHDPRDTRQRVLLGPITIGVARTVLVRHLRAHGSIQFENLVEELRQG